MLHSTISLLAVIDPGSGKSPPGSQKIADIVSWVAWVMLAAAVVGVMVCGGRMALAHQGHHGGGQHATSLGWVLGGCIVIGSASAIVGALV